MPDVTARAPFTARGLYRLLVLLALAGVVLPIVTAALKVSAEDFHVWRRWREADPARAAFFAEHTVLDVEHSLPFLADLAWQRPHELPFLRVYATHGAFNGVLLIALFVFRRRLLGWFEVGASWFNAPTERRARLTTFAFATAIVACYLTESSLGFYFPGIGGWTYRDWSATLRPALEPDPAEERVPTDAERVFLESAIIAEHARYLPGPGFLSGRAFFLHYAGGEVLPGSYELTDMVFPHYYFGGKHVRVDDPATFGAVLRNSLAYRRRGGRFLLPLGLSYPNHAVYAPIDYSQYPDPATLERVTFWKLSLRIDADLSPHLVSALEHYSVDV
jgi:hypothetical protein